MDDHSEILHTSRQYYCCDMCKILLWSTEQSLIHSTANVYRISDSIDIPLVERAPRNLWYDQVTNLLDDQWQ